MKLALTRLKEFRLKVLKEYRVKGKAFDFYIPDRNLLIEYDHKSLCRYMEEHENFKRKIDNMNKLVIKMRYKLLRFNYTTDIDHIFFSLTVMTDRKYCIKRNFGKFKLRRRMKSSCNLLIFR